MRESVLITRPKEDALSLAQLIEEKKYNVVCEPFLEVFLHENLLSNLEENYSGLIFTSRNAVRSFCENTENRSLSVWTVGGATRELALDCGFKDVRSADGTVQDLQAILPQNKEEKPLLYARGKDVSYDLSAENIHAEILYHTEKKQEIDVSVLNMIENGSFSHIAFFSKRTAQAFVELIETTKCEQGLIHTKALCLGSSMIQSVSVLSWKSIEVADQPNRDCMMKLLD